jgi:hypothetical protein
LIEPARKLVADICSEASLSFELRAADGAASNAKLMSHEFRLMGDQQLPAYVMCRNHQNHLISVSLSGFFGSTFSHDLYTSAVLLRTGSYFMRVLVALQQVVARDLEIRNCRSPDSCVAAARQLKQYLLLHYEATPGALLRLRPCPTTARAVATVRTPSVV